MAVIFLMAYRADYKRKHANKKGYQDKHNEDDGEAYVVGGFLIFSSNFN